MPTFGPGTLTIGETGSELEASCLVNSLTITAEKDEGDSTTKLCGSVKPGAVSYTYQMSGNLDTDTESPDGLFALSQAEPGSEQPFVFTPNTPTETAASGTLMLDPMDFGGEEYGEDMTSDVEWTLVGKPTYTYPEAPAAQTYAKQRFDRQVTDGRRPTGVRLAPEVTAKPAAKREKANA